jgi:hypothetical protein
MIEKIIFIYEESNPLGEWVHRYDDVYLTYMSEKERKETVRKTFAYLTANKGRIDCDFVHFCFDDGTSICCEAKREVIWHDNHTYNTYEKMGLIEVTRHDGRGNYDVPYLIDAATLRRQMYAVCNEPKEVAA